MKPRTNLHAVLPNPPDTANGQGFRAAGSQIKLAPSFATMTKYSIS
jgi:hypothetical protein